MDGAAQRAERLRTQLQAMFPGARSGGEKRRLERLPSGIASLDRLLFGGLPVGGVTAWCGREGDGLTSLLCATVSRTLLDGHRVAVVDGGRTLDPVDWARLGRGRRLWVIRPRAAAEALWAAEELARSGIFRLVALQLGSSSVRGSMGSVGSRLRGAAREGSTGLLVLGDLSPGCVGASLALRSEGRPPELAEGSRSLRLARIRGGGPEEVEVVFDVERRLFPRRLSAAPEVPDRRSSSSSRRAASASPGVDPGRRHTRSRGGL